MRNLSTGSGIGKPVIRGLSSNRVLVASDGLRLESQQWGDEHGPNVETADAESAAIRRDAKRHLGRWWWLRAYADQVRGIVAHSGSASSSVAPASLVCMASRAWALPR